MMLSGRALDARPAAQAARRTPAEGLLGITYLDRVHTALGAERARELGDEGQAMPLDDAIELALR